MAKAPIPKTAPIESNIKLQEHYKGAIALPSYNESKTLPAVLESLLKNPAEFIEQTLIIINVNNRTSADNSDNLKTLKFLQEFHSPLQLAWLNSTEEFSFADKFGVGLARHQACSSTYNFLSDHSPIISLDGDSPVNPEYLENIYKHFENPKHQAGHVHFKHRLVTGEKEKLAIQLYDKHLYLHREGLLKANSPHAWYAIGSTIVCTKKAYIKAGGYNPRRMAGEDFYLLQQLSKTGYKINIIDEAWVYPSNRQSDRVPFGTGKAVNEIVQEGEWLTYAPECYNELGRLLEVIESNLETSAEFIIKLLPPLTQNFLKQRKFHESWPKLQENSKTPQILKQRFHEWLDAFQTLKFIHFLTEKKYLKVKVSL
ncbi:MAG: glycosyltransferase family 2 protein [Lentisphaerales bacterium]|nr:glycosyltransferase family 2 protein [Lentisphaerales bacterium]